MFSSDRCELHTKMAAFAFAIGPVLDDSSCEKGAFLRECDHEFDFSVEIAAREAMRNVDSDARLTHIAGIQHVESSGTHDLNFSTGAKRPGMTRVLAQTGFRGAAAAKRPIPTRSEQLQTDLNGSPDYGLPTRKFQFPCRCVPRFTQTLRGHIFDNTRM